MIKVKVIIQLNMNCVQKKKNVAATTTITGLFKAILSEEDCKKYCTYVLYHGHAAF